MVWHPNVDSGNKCETLITLATGSALQKHDTAQQIFTINTRPNSCITLKQYVATLLHSLEKPVAPCSNFLHTLDKPAAPCNNSKHLETALLFTILFCLRGQGHKSLRNAVRNASLTVILLERNGLSNQTKVYD